MSEQKSQRNEVINLILSKLNDINDEISDLRERVASLEAKIEELSKRSDMVTALIKYVITPLIFLLAGLVGIKLVLPVS